MQKKKWNDRILSWSLDALALLCILFLCLSLIGFYGGFSYLDTGYQDWIYHAFRIREIERIGITSWDHVWSNGIMYWRSYQYIPHVVTLAVKQFFHISVNRAMIFVVIASYTTHFVTSFLLLRRLGVERRSALLGIITALTIASPWRAIKDFSIFFSFAFFPLFIYFWIQDIRRQQSSFRLAAFAGMSFLLHPVFGYVASCFFALTLPLKLEWRIIVHNILRGAVYFISAIAFLLPYFTKGYAFTNPILFADFFINGMKFDWTLGIGVLGLSLMIVSTALIILRVRTVPHWSKALCALAFVLLGFIALSSEKNLPREIFQLQLGRATLFVASTFSFIFASSFGFIANIRSRFFSSVLVVIACIFFVQAIEISSAIGARPRYTYISPVAEYLNSRPNVIGNTMVQGVTNVSEVSFFARPGLRFAHSYNEHLEHHPLAIRFENLFHENLLYTTISKRQVQLVESYARVLGTEYLFLPSVSPMIDRLTTGSASAQRAFSSETTLIAERNITAVHANWPIANAYAVQDPQILSFETMNTPTIHAHSWKDWDDEIVRLSGLMKDGSLAPLPINYPTPETLSLDLQGVPEGTKGIFVTQSFSEHWEIVGHEDVRIVPTSIRLIYIPLTDISEKRLILKHSWPKWHWPVQYTSLVFALTVIAINTMAMHFAKYKKSTRTAYDEEIRL